MQTFHYPEPETKTYICMDQSFSKTGECSSGDMQVPNVAYILKTVVQRNYRSISCAHFSLNSANWVWQCWKIDLAVMCDVD